MGKSAEVNPADCLFADAYAYFDQGVCFDEDGNKGEAKNMYNQGLELVDKATKMKNAKKSDLYAGIITTRDRILERVKELNSNSSSDISTSKVQNIRETFDAAGATGDAELIYWLPDGVQLVIIENDSTAAPTDPSSLAILKLDSSAIPKEMEDNKKALPQAFIQVGPWAYPLYSGSTTILKNKLGIYVVPNPTTDKSNMCVGIILPRDIDQRLEEEFVGVLKQFAVVRDSDIVEQMTAEQRQRTSERISQFLIRSGEILAQNVNRAATKTGEFVAEQGERYRAGFPQREGEPVNIHPGIRHGVYMLHKGTKTVGKVTKSLLDMIGDVGVAIGKRFTGSVGEESSGGRVFHSTARVVGGGLTGASTVWIALEDASQTLFKNFANETVHTVNAKYGDQASETTHHVLYAAGHTTLAGFRLWDLGPRAIAGRMARKAGLQIVQGYAGMTPRDAAAAQNASMHPLESHSSKSK
ncbi:senescence-associated protein domain-containing protein [Ditylenchus destructor]|uniref:Senescence-associated protein domain-containing protein n=1 Tax=Ditylenchus destructor TaxID=166010 RepID=A0AAD4NE04_9BILA|nr:senescence-associated protein domain-containing protein [Ditylenchus destructor]